MRRPSRLWLTLGIALTGTRSAGAEPGPAAPHAERLTLEQALATARARNPAIQAADARYRAMRERPVQEGTLPDPTLAVRYHNEDWGISFGDSEFSFFEVGAEQEIPFPGKLSLRERIAEREAERGRAMRDMTELMVLATVATHYAELSVAERSEEILRESAHWLDWMLEESASRYRVGDAAQQDVLRAGLERNTLEERRTLVARERTAARAALASLLALPADEALPPTAPLPEPRPLPPIEALARRLAEQSPSLRAASEDLARSEEALRLARREYFPDFSLMAAYTNKDGLLPEWELGARVRVPLYFWRRQRRGVAEASLSRDAARHERHSEQLTLEARLAELHATAEAAARLVRLYGETLLPQAELTLASARASYAVGRVDFLTTLTAFVALLEYRLRSVEESGRLATSLAEIGPLVGETPLGEPLGAAP